MTLTFDLVTPKVDCFAPLPCRPLVASKSVHWFQTTCSQVRQQMDERTSGRVELEHCATAVQSRLTTRTTVSLNWALQPETATSDNDAASNNDEPLTGPVAVMTSAKQATLTSWFMDVCIIAYYTDVHGWLHHLQPHRQLRRLLANSKVIVIMWGGRTQFNDSLLWQRSDFNAIVASVVYVLRIVYIRLYKPEQTNSQIIWSFRRPYATTVQSEC